MSAPRTHQSESEDEGQDGRDSIDQLDRFQFLNSTGSKANSGDFGPADPTGSSSISKKLNLAKRFIRRSLQFTGSSSSRTHSFSSPQSPLDRHEFDSLKQFAYLSGGEGDRGGRDVSTPSSPISSDNCKSDEERQYQIFLQQQQQQQPPRNGSESTLSVSLSKSPPSSKLFPQSTPDASLLTDSFGTRALEYPLNDSWDRKKSAGFSLFTKRSSSSPSTASQKNTNSPNFLEDRFRFDDGNFAKFLGQDR